MNDERQLSSREKLIEAVNDYLSELEKHKAIEKRYQESQRAIDIVGRRLESVYFDLTTSATGQIIAVDKNGRPIMIELGRSGRVYPKVIEIETYIEL